jgi:hypothetical protein
LRKEDVLYVVRMKILYYETRKWREQSLNRKWPMLNEGIACEKIINCTNIIELRNTGTDLYKIRCKWENKTSNLLSELGRGE